MTRNILNPSQSYLKVTAIFCQRLSVTQLKQQRKKNAGTIQRRSSVGQDSLGHLGHNVLRCYF